MAPAKPHPLAERRMIVDLLKAIVLGIVEGLTEFLPVSSTGHLLLVEHFFGFSDDDLGKTFTILIQLGAILALLTIYSGRLWKVAMALPSDPAARRFVIGVLVAFLPAAVIGALAYGFIKTILFNAWIVCSMLVVGGFVLMWVDRLDLKAVHHDAMRFPLSAYLGIGVVQCLAMIPGVSRSGSTIVAGLLFGADKRAAAEFSFYLAMPTMVGAFTLSLYKDWHQLSGDGLIIIAAGFVASFVAGWIVVKTFLDYVSRQGFALFAWWRIIVGALGLIGLALIG
jgi:undecaprenyl-diphosphatase